MTEERLTVKAPLHLWDEAALAAQDAAEIAPNEIAQVGGEGVVTIIKSAEGRRGYRVKRTEEGVVVAPEPMHDQQRDAK